jgi:hypothetical protein
MVAEKDRFNLDDDVAQKSSIGTDLLKDVAEVTRQAKQRIELDKARDKQLASAGKHRALIYAIICFVALVMILIAWKINFGSSENPSAGGKDGFYPMRGATSQPAQPSPVYQKPQAAPKPAAPPPPSEPVRRNPTETYDEGPDQDGAM